MSSGTACSVRFRCHLVPGFGSQATTAASPTLRFVRQETFQCTCLCFCRVFVLILLDFVGFCWIYLVSSSDCTFDEGLLILFRTSELICKQSTCALLQLPLGLSYNCLLQYNTINLTQSICAVTCAVLCIVLVTSLGMDLVTLASCRLIK